ncbi:MAG: MurR/RpiR family transcriptional regulator [Pseudobutyrivibrio sp.]|nr:MurR/RpiR family transcriptional regulator [Pseudobutyrivibrio sp.]
MMQYEKDILPIIKLHYEEFSTAEKTAADYFLNNKYKEDFSAKEVANRLFISEATLSRFAKKCGYTGYRQFVFHYQERFASEGVRVLRDETRHILDTYQELLNHSYTLVDEKQIKRVASLITKKRRVFLYGKGSSGIAGSEFALRLMRLGIDIDCITDSHVMNMNSAVINEDCVAIGITVSGKTPVVIRALQTAKKKEASTVLISAVHRTEWDEFCDELLPIPTKEMLDLGKLISPQFPILILLDILYADILQIDRLGKEALHEMTLAELNSEMMRLYPDEKR